MQRGFSLVELSIVLVILGLLTGGILAGQSLIRASELRAASTEYGRYTAAAQTFRDKYFAIPGDFRDATRFWGRLNTNADCASNHGLASASAPGACDGDGDGVVEGSMVAGGSVERFQLFRHLALAGLIEGTYTGLAGTSNDREAILGSNVPRSRLSNAGWWALGFAAPEPGSTDTFALDYGNAFTFGAAVTGEWPNGPVLKPEEAWNIDVKLDDGKPATGTVIARYRNNACAVSASATDSASTYKLDDNALRCALYFRRTF